MLEISFSTVVAAVTSKRNDVHSAVCFFCSKETDSGCNDHAGEHMAEGGEGARRGKFLTCTEGGCNVMSIVGKTQKIENCQYWAGGGGGVAECR